MFHVTLTLAMRFSRWVRRQRAGSGGAGGTHTHSHLGVARRLHPACDLPYLHSHAPPPPHHPPTRPPRSLYPPSLPRCFLLDRLPRFRQPLRVPVGPSPPRSTRGRTLRSTATRSPPGSSMTRRCLTSRVGGPLCPLHMYQHCDHPRCSQRWGRSVARRGVEGTRRHWEGTYLPHF